MTEEIILKAEPRSETKGGNPKRMLKEDILPAVVYGPGSKNINLKLNLQKFIKVFEIAGESKVVNLKVGDETMQVFIHRLQHNPITNKISHVDFYQFKKDHKFSIEIPINFVGESRAIKEDGGVLVTDIDSIQIECLYTNLISEVEVDLGKLENLNDSIHVSDLKFTEGINVLTSPERVIVTVQPMRTQEEEQAQEEEGEVEAETSSEETEETEEKGDGVQEGDADPTKEEGEKVKSEEKKE